LGLAGSQEFYGLGAGDPVAISAEHGEGLDELGDRLGEIATAVVSASEQELAQSGEAGLQELFQDRNPAVDPVVDPESSINIAVVGRPNVGKSTLINRILGRDRFLTGPQAGITRDAISVRLNWSNLPVRIWDTAGLRKKARIKARLEKISVSDALRAVRFSELVVVLVDADSGFESQDLRIADLTAREGRAAVVAVNKWDLIEDGHRRRERLTQDFTRLLPQLRGAPVVMISAKTGHGIDRLQAAVRSAFKVWNRRIPTAALNRWLEVKTQVHPPPAPGGRRIRLRYMTQIKIRPPGFVIMCSRPRLVGEDYRRYIINGLRDDFGLPGTPIRLTLRSKPDRNPYRPA